MQVLGASPPLVNITEFHAAQNAKIVAIGGKTKKTPYESDENGKIRNERFLRYEMQSAAKHVLPKHRVAICLRNMLNPMGAVDVIRHRTSGKAFYGGLMVCGSGWVCPVCASKISERRRGELQTAFKSHLANGGHCTMLTLTFSHSARDKLSDLITALVGDKDAKPKGALTSFRSTRRYTNWANSIGVIGSIRALEVTYGSNGWHPHIHLLLLHTREIDPWDHMGFEDEAYEMWSIACKANGLTCSRAHGVDLQDAADASTYIGKYGDIMDKRWGTDSEMAKANIKRGRAESMTPFDMLRKIVEDGDLEYEHLYQEFAAAVKGKHQLSWSRGLKSKFLIEEKTDEEIATEKVEEADILGGICYEDWRYICQNRLRAKLLDQVEKYGYEDAIISILADKKKNARDGVQVDKPQSKGHL